MRKALCFAILALAALADDTGARHEFLSPNPDTLSGFGVVWTNPGEIGVLAHIDTVLPGLGADVILRLRATDGGPVVVTAFPVTLVTGSNGSATGTGAVTVNPAWDTDGDGVLYATLGVRIGGGFTMNTAPFAVVLR